MDIINTILIALILPLLVALITAITTSNAAINRFRNERLWELKVETYDGVFDALFDFNEFFEIQLRATIWDDLEEGELDDVIDNYNEASYYLGSILFKGEFIIHNDAINELSELNRALQIKEPGFWEDLLTGNTRYKFYKKQSKLVLGSTERLRLIAKNDLKA